MNYETKKFKGVADHEYDLDRDLEKIEIKSKQNIQSRLSRIEYLKKDQEWTTGEMDALQDKLQKFKDLHATQKVALEE